MRINERWLYIETAGDRSDDLEVQRSRGEWFVVRPRARAPQAIGPYRGDEIVRAFRVASHGVIDGCEHGPPGRGFDVLGPIKRPARRDWITLRSDELPPSRTVYSPEDAAPCSGCETTFDEYPAIVACDLAALASGDRALLGDVTQVGSLRRSWNAHPVGSRIGWSGAVEDGFTIIDHSDGFEGER